jgi:flagellar biosynthesis protein FlhG
VRIAAETHYDVLGLPPRASADQIERAYRHAASVYDEDSVVTYSLLDGEERAAARTRVDEAYRVLRDAGRRRAYDAELGLDALAASAPGEIVPRGSTECPPPPPRVVLPEPVTGPDLRKFRESRAITLRDIATASKVGVRFLGYIEADRFDALPAPVYVRGFVQEYARAVGLDPRATAESYLARMAR